MDLTGKLDYIHNLRRWTLQIERDRGYSREGEDLRSELEYEEKEYYDYKFKAEIIGTPEWYFENGIDPETGEYIKEEEG